jgi:hypothetical protein
LSRCKAFVLRFGKTGEEPASLVRVLSDHRDITIGSFWAKHVRAYRDPDSYKQVISVKIKIPPKLIGSVKRYVGEGRKKRTLSLWQWQKV